MICFRYLTKLSFLTVQCIGVQKIEWIIEIIKMHPYLLNQNYCSQDFLDFTKRQRQDWPGMRLI